MEFIFETDYRWVDLIASTGREGQAWLDEYHRRSDDLQASFREALRLLRERKLTQGWELLCAAESEWLPLRSTAPTIFHVTGRFYHGTLAYYHYCVEDYSRADSTLDDALSSLSAAIELQPFLMAIAPVGTDIPLKQAQVSRARRDWDEMRYRVGIVRDILADRRPLCVLGNETPVYHWTIADRYFDGSRPPEGQNSSVRYLRDTNIRGTVFATLVQGLYYLPGWLIPYP
jgi:hypothetical protein